MSALTLCHLRKLATPKNPKTVIGKGSHDVPGDGQMFPDVSFDIERDRK
jgi:hypothetical protein